MPIQNSATAHDAIAGAAEVLNRLSGAFMLATKNNSKTIFYSRSRVKDPGSIIEKLFDRQLRYGEVYSIESITDIVGYRLVVLYDDQLLSAFRLAIQVLKNSHYSEDPLITDAELWKNIHEIKFFPRSQRYDDPYKVIHDALLSDPTTVGQPPSDWKNKVKLGDPVGVPGSKSAYSSMHIIAYTTSYSLGTPKLVPLELQIRTAVEDIWSEISHENEYKVRKRNAWSPELKDLYEENNSEVNKLKAQLNTLVPDALTKIRGNTKSVYTELARLRVSPVAQYSSYVLNLAYHIGASIFDKQTRAKFAKYEDCVERIKSGYSMRRDNPERANVLLSEFLKAKSALSEISKVSFTDADCQSSFNGLIRLEQARLDAIEIRILQTQLKQTDSERVQTTARADRLYSVLDEIQSDDTIHLKPISVIEYFKYYVFRYGSHKNQQLVRDHLNACYTALKIDPTVDQDGMIVVMATRALAESFWAAAEEYREMLRDAQNAFLLREMKDRYRTAFRLAVESRATYERRDKKATADKIDDLIFHTSPFQEHTCTNNVVMYATDCILNEVGEEIFAETQYGLSNLEFDLKRLLDFLESDEGGKIDIWHTTMIGFGALAQSKYNTDTNSARASAIAKRILEGSLPKSAHKRVEVDARRVLDLYS